MTASKNVLKLCNGRSIPTLGLGTWKSKPGEVEKAVAHALKIGYRHIDAAAVYGNEVEVGAGIAVSGVAREEMFITSKLWNNKHHPEDVEPSCRKTLKDLGLDYIDLYLIHWPYAFRRGDVPFPKNDDGSVEYDLDVDYVDTWVAMEKLVHAGIVKSIGLSNFNSEQIERILEKGSVKPVVNQVECHPYLNQAKLITFCANRDIAITAYSPLGSPDRPWATKDDVNLLDDVNIAAIAERHGKSAAQVVLRWQVQRGLVVIPKSVTAGRIQQNAEIFDFSLTEEEVETINGFDCGGRIIVPMLDGKPRDAAHPHYPFNIEF